MIADRSGKVLIDRDIMYRLGAPSFINFDDVGL